VNDSRIRRFGGIAKLGIKLTAAAGTVGLSKESAKRFDTDTIPGRNRCPPALPNSKPTLWREQYWRGSPKRPHSSKYLEHHLFDMVAVKS
jgi:hypothetical protein